MSRDRDHNRDSTPLDELNGDKEADVDPEKANSPESNDLAPTKTHDPAFEVSFDGLSDPMNPRGRYSNGMKWLFVLICSSTSLCVTCASSLYTMTYDQLEVEFSVSETVATLGLSMFVAGLGLGPMVLSPLSEVSHPQTSWDFELLKNAN